MLPFDYPYAPFWKRVVAYIADAFVQGLLWLIVSPIVHLFVPLPHYDLRTLLTVLSGNPSANATDMLNQINPVAIGVAILVQYILRGVMDWLYHACFESSILQATPGKLLLGLKVTDLYGNRLNFGRATARAFARGLTDLTCYIGYIMAAYTERRQTLHDMIAGTVVIEK